MPDVKSAYREAERQGSHSDQEVRSRNAVPF
jgi:hypothetical protein